MNIVLLIASLYGIYLAIFDPQYTWRDIKAEHWKMLGLNIACLIGFPAFLHKRIQNAKRIDITSAQRILTINRLSWRKFGWQPETVLQYDDIQAFAYSGSFTRKGMAWLVLNNGEKIWLQSGTDNSRVKIFAQDLAKQAGLSFMKIAVEKDDEQFV